MSEEGRGEIPERIWAVIGFATEVSQGAIWASFSSEESARNYPGPRMLECAPRSVVEYVRAQPPTADAEQLAYELISEYFDRDDMGRLRTAIATALSAARQQGRDEQRERVRNMETVHADACDGPLDCSCGAENTRQQIYFALESLTLDQLEQEQPK